MSRIGKRTLTIPAGVTTIGKYVFCYSVLTNITIPARIATNVSKNINI